MKIDKSWYIKPRKPNFPIRITAGGVVARKEKSKIMIAFIGESSYSDYRLPKGGKEDNENIEETARREIAEELGLSNLRLICKLGIKERLSFEKSDWRIGHYFLFKTNKSSGRQNLQKGEEGFKLKWFDVDDLPPIFWPEQKKLIEENRDKIIKKILG